MVNRRTNSRDFGCDETGIRTGESMISAWRPAIRTWIVISVLVSAIAATPALAMGEGNQGGDAKAGKAVIERSGCLKCHSIGGSGNDSAPDLAFRSIFHRQSPAETAAKMWNHAPKMWELMKGEAIEIPGVSRADAEDVYAFFRSARYFDLRGEVIRGKKVFSEKGCRTCHQLISQSAAEGGGPPVSEWNTHFDTAEWTSSLWNHAGTMLGKMEASGIDWPTFSEQEMVDLLLYLRTSMGRRQPMNEFTLSDPSSGKAVFEDRGCADCHTLGSGDSGKVNLSAAARDARTMSSLAAAMWNHIPQMYGKSAEGTGHLDTLTPDQVSSLASFFYFEGTFSEIGNPAKGQRVFKKKGCDTCHASGALMLPPPGDERFNAPTMMSAVWTHGPSMLGEMKDRGIDWPEFSEKEMENLIAFLNGGR